MSSASSFDYSANEAHAIQFTVNPVLFSYCGNLVGSSSRFTHAALMRLRAKSGNRTSMCFDSWNELATSLLKMTPTEARHIFDVFYAVSGGCIQGMPSSARHTSNQKEIVYYRHDNNRSLLNQMGGTIDDRTWANVSSSRLVSTAGLMMFLSAQLFLSGSTGATRYDDIKQADYLKTNIHDYITVISVGRQYKVTPQDISDLEFVLRQFIDAKETAVGVGEDAFPWQHEQDGEHVVNVMSVALLSQFIRSRVVPANALPAVRDDERKLSVVDLKDAFYLLPRLPNLDVTLSFLSATCDIARCARTSVYLPCPLPNTRISHLENCTVVLGPVVGVLLIENCVNCRISALCGSVVIAECENVQLYVCPNTPPVLLQGLQSVFLAPYNTFYAMISKDCQDTGINPILNLWNIGVRASFLLPPERYTPISFLVSPAVSKEWSSRGVAPTTTNICRVPSPYQNAVKSRLQNFQNISNNIRGTYKLLQEEGHANEANLLRSKIHSMFIAWVHQNGQGKALADLLHQPNPS
eukprot:gene8410-5891_t